MAAVPPVSTPPLSPLTQQTPPFDVFPIEESKDAVLEELHYVLCNEEGQGETLLNLPESRKNGVHLGFACWMNFDILAKQNTPFAVLCDCNENMIALLDLIKSTVLDSNSPAAFIENFWQKLSQNPSLNFDGLLGIHGSLDKSGFSRLTEAGGWLSSRDSFQVIQDMYKKNRILHRSLNISDQDAFTKLKTWATRHNLVFDTIYTSNIAEWLHHSRGAVDIMVDNINQLTDPKTSIVSAQKKTGEVKKEIPEQTLNTGSHPTLKYTRPPPAQQARTNQAGPPPPPLAFC